MTSNDVELTYTFLTMMSLRINFSINESCDVMVEAMLDVGSEALIYVISSLIVLVVYISIISNYIFYYISII